jgi:hypothetical protein
MLLAILSGTAKAACVHSSWKQAKLRCASSTDVHTCNANAYRALEGGAADVFQCTQDDLMGILDKHAEHTNEVPGPSSSATTHSGSTSANSAPINSGSSFQGVAPFGSVNRNPLPQSPYGGLPQSVQQHLQMMMGGFMPPGPNNYYQSNMPYKQCQGTAKADLQGYDFSGQGTGKTTLKKFEIMSFVRKQTNNGVDYLLASNGIWYKKSSIALTSDCSLN